MRLAKPTRDNLCVFSSKPHRSAQPIAMPCRATRTTAWQRCPRPPRQPGAVPPTREPGGTFCKPLLPAEHKGMEWGDRFLSPVALSGRRSQGHIARAPNATAADRQCKQDKGACGIEPRPRLSNPGPWLHRGGHGQTRAPEPRGGSAAEAYAAARFCGFKYRGVVLLCRCHIVVLLFC